MCKLLNNNQDKRVYFSGGENMRKKLWIFMLVAVLAIISITGCTSSEETIVAEINDKTITLSQFNQYFVIYSNAAQGQAGDDETAKKQVLTSMVDMEAIKEYLKSKDIEPDETIDETYNQYREFINQNEESKKFMEDNNISDDFIKEMFTSQWYEEKFVEEIRTTMDVDTKVNAYYEENKAAQFSNEEVRASHILVDTEELAEELKKKIDNGENFETLAKENSTCPSSQQGGDLGFFTETKMVQPFGETAFAMEIGEISDVVQTQFGYHVIKLTDKRSEQPLEEVHDYIESIIISEEYGKKVEEIKKDMDIKEYTDKL